MLAVLLHGEFMSLQEKVYDIHNSGFLKTVAKREYLGSSF
jgi:hypothetical protein